MNAADEMTTREAVGYLNVRLDSPVNPKIMYTLRRVGIAPMAEKRGSRLVFLRKNLDAFLAEYGTDPLMWHTGWARDAIDDLRARGIYEPDVESLLLGLDPHPNEPRPSDFQ